MLTRGEDAKAGAGLWGPEEAGHRVWRAHRRPALVAFSQDETKKAMLEEGG